MDSMLNRAQVLKLANVSDSTLDRLIKRGDFPQPVRLSLRRCGWRTSAVQQWLESRAPGPMRANALTLPAFSQGARTAAAE